MNLKEMDRLFKYDVINGGLIRKVSVSKNTKEGDRAGRETSGGYFSTTIKSKETQIHRIIYFMFNGFLPDFIDHKDGNPLNNKIDNLRGCTNSQNQYNKKIQKNNTSGYKNIYKKNNGWIVLFRVNKRLKSYGVYRNISDAIKTAETIRLSMHKEFARSF